MLMKVWFGERVCSVLHAYYWYVTPTMLIPYVGFCHSPRITTLGLLGIVMTISNARTLPFNQLSLVGLIKFLELETPSLFECLVFGLLGMVMIVWKTPTIPFNPLLLVGLI